MQITFRQAADAGAARLVARIVEQDKLPGTLERALAEGARAARFSGKTGQSIEDFVERCDAVVRVALAGAGSDGEGRAAGLERAGAALAAKYLTSGETSLALDASGLRAAEVASVLTGLSLRANIGTYFGVWTDVDPLDKERIARRDLTIVSIMEDLRRRNRSP